MPITWPLRLRSGPPELPGFTAASNWIMPLMVSPLPSGKERLRPEMTPADSDATSPSGWPTANASSPTWAPPPSTAGTTTSGRRGRRQHRDVVVGVGRPDRRRRLGAVGERDPDAPGALDDVERGEDVTPGR